MPEEADIVIIGSGIAGALCAWKLAQRGLKVLIVEAGPRMERAELVDKFKIAYRQDASAEYPNLPSAPRPDWGKQGDKYIAQTGPDIAYFEYLRLVGGTTWHWSGGAERLLPADLQLRSAYGVSLDWPVTYDDLEPYYVEAEREMGVSGSDQQSLVPRSAPYPLPEIPFGHAEKVIAEKLHDLDSTWRSNPAARNSRLYDGRPQCDGFGTCVPICPIGAQYAAITHVVKAEKLGVRVLANSRVDRIESDAAGRIIQLRIGRPDGSSDVVKGRLFLLAANPIESPRLLLASADEARPRGLANSSDQVGRNFMTHPAIHVGFETPFPLYAGRGPVAIAASSAHRDGAFRAFESAANIGINNPSRFTGLATAVLRSDLMPPGLDKELRYRATRLGSFHAFVEQLADPDNRITIDWGNRDSAGQPRIQLRFSIGDYERRALARTRSRLEQFLTRLDATHLEWAETSVNHLMGTLRMGVDSRHCVADASGRAYDHPNLFIAGGALFPSCGTVGPTLTIAALALRTAEAMARQLT